MRCASIRLTLRHTLLAGADLQSLPGAELQQLLAAYETAAAACDAKNPTQVSLVR